MNKIITIGREFGSGGRELGRRLAEELGIAYYDREIIAEIAKRTELSEQYVQQIVEHRPLNLMPITIGHSICPVPHPLMEQNQEIYRQQAQILTEMSQKSDCVLVAPFSSRVELIIFCAVAVDSFDLFAHFMVA